MDVTGDTSTLVVKNTFIDIPEEPAEPVVRSTKSVPFSFKSHAKGLEDLQLSFVDTVPEEEDQPAHDSPGSDKLATPPMLDLQGGRVRAVRFMLPSEESRLIVKNTFFTVQEEGGSTPTVRPTKSVPVSFKPDESSPGGDMLPLSPAASPARSPARDRLSPGEDSDASPTSPTSPALCHLRTLSLGSRAEGPHLGLLWAPEGHEWGPHSRLRTALGELIMQQPVQPTAEPEPPAASAPAAPVLAPPPRDPGVVKAPVPVPEGVVGSVLGRVWALSEDSQGCREVQRALDEGNSTTTALIAEELKGHIVEAMRSPYANFVLQKLIQLVPPSSIEFMAAEIDTEECIQAAKHKFGCRIIQRLIEFWPPETTRNIVDAIFSDFAAIARHPYGNYVVQNIMVNGTDEARTRVIRNITDDICSLSSDGFGCTVVVAVFTKGRPEDQLVVARSILHEEGLLVFIACTRHGHVAAARILEVLSGQELENARFILRTEIDTLQASKFGRNVSELL